ncbi:NXPE family member 3-like [Cheilinus undulatus]|uniref:NXPE family member 3-like n=1 Tax=Cheilinus undulatus TaxID=241271 RepID=UPI001BD67045|nr:NXPE family member 3-like [Cheilinus undulatus]
MSSGPPVSKNFSTFKPLSSKDAMEEHLLLDSIAWPTAPFLSPHFSLEQTTDPAHSTFTILPLSGGVQWHVGDQLEVGIQMKDFQGHAKKSGGDFLLARLHNRKLEAGVAGRVVDHLNGSYSAVFTLLWEGSAQVEVTLVHPSEAVSVLQQLAREQPFRIFFKSTFRSGTVSENSSCNAYLRQTNQPLCNFTDPRTGEPWFCYKPKKLSCDARINHMRGEPRIKLGAKEKKLLQRKLNMKVSIQASGPSSVTVFPPKKDQPKVRKSSRKSGVSGYYYQGVWQSLCGAKVHQFNDSSAIRECLKGKMVYMYGDSTIRQWFEYLSALLPDAKELFLTSPNRTGPFMMWDITKNIQVTYHCHGPPLSFNPIPTSQLRYIANELDGLLGGNNTVVVVGIWAHFSPFPIELYIRRLQNIRKAVVRLLSRAPGTLVVIRTANLRDLTTNLALVHSDWYTFQRYRVLRAIFEGLKVQIVDAWEMNLAHHLPHNLHPQPPILKNMVNTLLSYICPL